MRVTQKRVKVLHNGPIKAKGWVYGPILNPYMESTKIIFAMLKDSVRVVEVLKDGSSLILNATNFDKDNNIGLGGDNGLGDDDLIQPTISNVTEVKEIEKAIVIEDVLPENIEVEEVHDEVVSEVEDVRQNKNKNKKSKKNK